jgi:hypothetical protein
VPALSLIGWPKDTYKIHSRQLFYQLFLKNISEKNHAKSCLVFQSSYLHAIKIKRGVTSQKTEIKVMKQEIAKLIDQALQDQLKDVGNSFPSIFSKDDVKHQLEEFGYGLITIVMEMKEETKSARSISLEGVQELSELLIKSINDKINRLDSEDVVDFSSASFSIGYSNQVEIDSMDFNSDEITDIIDITVDEVLHDFFTPEEEEIVNETPYATEQ